MLKGMLISSAFNYFYQIGAYLIITHIAEEAFSAFLFLAFFSGFFVANNGLLTLQMKTQKVM